MCSEKIHVVSSAFSEEETVHDQVPLTLYRCYEDAIFCQGIGSIAILRGLTLILKFLSQYGVNFKCKATVQLFHPCTGADFHLSGP